jgi:hypothetical protein
MINQFCSVVLIFFISTSALSQDISGNLEGLVSDSLGSPLPGVNVTVQSENLQGLKGTATNEKGYFSIFYLPVGNYKVKISMVGYGELVIEKVQIRLGKTTYLGEFKLVQEAINLPEITVSAEKENIDPTSTTYGGNIQPKYFDQLPVYRDYKSIVTLLPQANTSGFGDGVNIGGSTGFENKFFIDGVEVTDPLFARDGMNLPYNFMQEVELKAGGYEAEYRSALGGLVNVVTYSGTNDFHGSVFGFYTGNSLTGNSELGLLDPTQGDFTLYDIGFSLRGPILKDRLWFNAAYNPTFENHDVEVPDFGTHVNKSIMHSFASKLTWSVSQQFQLMLTGTGDPTNIDGVGRWVLVPPDSMVNPDSYYQNFTEGTYSFSLKGIYTVNQNLLLTASVARVNKRDTGEPATEEGNDPLFYDEMTNTQSGGTGGWYDSYRYNTIANVSGTYSFNTHNLSVGIEYKVNGTDNRYFYHNITEFFNTARNDTFFSVAIGEGFQTVQQRIPSFYIQDSWQVFKTLRFNIGIRWDGQYVIGSDDKLDQTIEIPLQPRLGLTFSPNEDGSQKFFGSYGRYSQELNLGTSLAFSDQGYDSTFYYRQDPRVSREGEYVSIYSGPHSIAPELEGLEGQYYDEFSLGYERLFWNNFKVSVQGLYRTLGQAIEDGYSLSEQRFVTANPGKYPFQDRPEATRDYAALIISFERRGNEYFNFLASYVLSRDYGNYEGLFDAFYHSGFPNLNYSFDNPLEVSNIYGLVPNDRTHVFKFSGSYRFSFGLNAGLSFVVQSGTPLSDYTYISFEPGIRFLSQRGSAGRTPTIWDLGVRFTYELPSMNLFRPRLIMDLFHIASQQEPVDIDQLHYFGTDENGNPTDPNPTYGRAYRYQQPMSMRLGMEINF